MSDLISRKALIEVLKTHFDADYNEDGRLLYSDHICTGEDVEDLIKLVDAQPTAYDVDKVVEQLEKFKQLECGDTNDDIELYELGRSQGKLEAYLNAIEIVKSRGAK